MRSGAHGVWKSVVPVDLSWRIGVLSSCDCRSQVSGFWWFETKKSVRLLNSGGARCYSEREIEMRDHVGVGRFSTAALLTVLAGCQTVSMRSMKIYVQQNQWPEAKAQAELAVEAEPDNPEAWYEKGRIHANLDEYVQMKLSFAHSEALSDKYSGTIAEFCEQKWIDLYNRGVTRLDEEQVDSAIADFKLGIWIFPSRVETHRVLGSEYLKLGKTDSAVVYFAQTLDREPEDVQVTDVLAQIYAQQKDYPAAIELLQRARAVDPENQSVSLTLINSYGLAGLTDSVAALAAKLPDDRDIQFAAGVSFLQIQPHTDTTLETALRLLQRAVEIDPTYTDATFNLAFALLRLGRSHEAIAPLETIVTHSPDDLQAWFALGRAHTRLAGEHATAAQRHRDNDDETQAAGEDRVAKEGFGKAEKALRRCADVQPTTPAERTRYADAHRLLANVYAQTDRTTEAKAAFQVYNEYK